MRVRGAVAGWCWRPRYHISFPGWCCQNEPEAGLNVYVFPWPSTYQGGKASPHAKLLGILVLQVGRVCCEHYGNDWWANTCGHPYKHRVFL